MARSSPAGKIDILGTGSCELIPSHHGGHGGHGEKPNSDQAFSVLSVCSVVKYRFFHSFLSPEFLGPWTDMRLEHPARGTGNKIVVIVGGGFGGLNAAKRLANAPGVHVLLVDQRNHHLF